MLFQFWRTWVSEWVSKKKNTSWLSPKINKKWRKKMSFFIIFLNFFWRFFFLEKNGEKMDFFLEIFFLEIFRGWIVGGVRAARSKSQSCPLQIAKPPPPPGVFTIQPHCYYKLMFGRRRLLKKKSHRSWPKIFDFFDHPHFVQKLFKIRWLLNCGGSSHPPLRRLPSPPQEPPSHPGPFWLSIAWNIKLQ